MTRAPLHLDSRPTPLTPDSDSRILCGSALLSRCVHHLFGLLADEAHRRRGNRWVGARPLVAANDHMAAPFFDGLAKGLHAELTERRAHLPVQQCPAFGERLSPAQADVVVANHSFRLRLKVHPHRIEAGASAAAQHLDPIWSVLAKLVSIPELIEN